MFAQMRRFRQASRIEATRPRADVLPKAWLRDFAWLFSRVKSEAQRQATFTSSNHGLGTLGQISANGHAPSRPTNGPRREMAPECPAAMAREKPQCVKRPDSTGFLAASEIGEIVARGPELGP